MGQTLTEIAQALKDANKKVQLIYAFNGTGKTLLSRKFKELIAPKEMDAVADEDGDESIGKMLYYNAFTEDLFYWDNDLEAVSDLDAIRKLKIQPNSFTDWVLAEQGQENNIAAHFRHYTSDKLTPRFNEQYTAKDKEGNDITIKAYSEIAFSIEGGNDEKIENIKISKGEESCLIWCLFHSLLEQVIYVLNEPEPTERGTSKFNAVEYVFIDDPVSSLDDNHLIELAVDIAKLIKLNKSDLKFIITTHNPLFYNVLFNQFRNDDKRTGYKAKDSIKYRIDKLGDGTFLIIKSNDSPFSYHLLLLTELEKAIETNDIQKYHFNFLRNILEKTSTFLGYESWRELLPQEAREEYYNRIINLYSHSKHSGEESSIVKDSDKRVLSYLLEEVKTRCSFKRDNNNVNEQ